MSEEGRIESVLSVTFCRNAENGIRSYSHRAQKFKVHEERGLGCASAMESDTEASRACVEVGCGCPEFVEQRSRTYRSALDRAVEDLRQRPIMLHEAGHRVLREIKMRQALAGFLGRLEMRHESRRRYATHANVWKCVNERVGACTEAECVHGALRRLMRFRRRGFAIMLVIKLHRMIQTTATDCRIDVL